MSENELDSLMRQADMSRKEAVEESMDWSGEGKVVAPTFKMVVEEA